MTVQPLQFDQLFKDFEITQFKERAKTVSLLLALAVLLQDVSTVAQEIIRQLDPYQAVGAQLDKIGRVVREARNGRTDTDYRVAILARIYINQTDGTIDDIIFAVSAITGSGHVEIFDVYPAGIIVGIQAPYSNGTLAAQTINAVRAGGVELIAAVEIGACVGAEDYTVADIAGLLALTEPPLVVGDLVLVTDATSIYQYNGPNPAAIGDWELVGPPLVFDGLDCGDGLADLTDVTGSGELIGGGVLAELIA